MGLRGVRLLLVSMCLLFASGAFAQQYTVTDLGTLGGTSFYGTQALAINAAGHVVGWSPIPGGDPHPFLWTPDHGLQDLGTLPGASYCAATAINDIDHVVGHCTGGERGAFVWTPDNGMTRLDFAQSQGPIAAGINNQEEILVNTSQGAFVVRGGAIQSLGFYWAWGINDAGQIVGEDVYAVLWDEAGRHDLGTMDGFRRSHAYAISATGLIVGACDDDSNFPHATVWNGFGIENLGTLGSDFGRAQSVARAINGDIIVGLSTAANGGGAVHAVLYDHNGPGYFIDLNDLIPADSGWVLGAANGINANGQIVGSGAMNGEQHAFLLTPVQSAASGGGGGGTGACVAGTPGTLSPCSGTPVAVPGQINAERFDNGGEGVAYHDSDAANNGGQFRTTGVDIETSSEGGYDVGWIAAGEWLNYTVNVTSAGSYTVQLRVASPGGASLHVGFNGPSAGQWKTVAVPATGGWQNWTTVSVPVTLGAGTQQMTVLFDSGGMNFRLATVGP